MIRNILFDWSGTLVDDLPAVWQATNHVFQKAGLAHLPMEQFRAEFCLPFKVFYDRFTPHVPMEQLEEWFHGHFKEVQDSVRELPHAREMLVACRKRGVRCFVLSTIHRDHFMTQSAVTGFHEHMERAYVEVLDKRAKIRELLEENQLAAQETLFIGDMQHDIETARHGGVFSCAVLTGYSTLAQLREAGPDLIVEHLGELLELLERNSWQFSNRGLPQNSPDALYPTVTVGALIFDAQHRVLMVRTQKWSNRWGIPGGKIKFGEGSERALARELKEETNLDVSGIELVMVQDCIRPQEFYREAHFILLNYICHRTGSSEVELNDEAQEFQWVSLPQALELNLNEPTRKLLDHVLSQREILIKTR